MRTLNKGYSDLTLFTYFICLIFESSTALLKPIVRPSEIRQADFATDSPDTAEIPIEVHRTSKKELRSERYQYQRPSPAWVNNPNKFHDHHPPITQTQLSWGESRDKGFVTWRPPSKDDEEEDAHYNKPPKKPLGGDSAGFRIKSGVFIQLLTSLTFFLPLFLVK